jgi:hypothetical protein
LLPCGSGFRNPTADRFAMKSAAGEHDLNPASVCLSDMLPGTALHTCIMHSWSEHPAANNPKTLMQPPNRRNLSQHRCAMSGFQAWCSRRQPGSPALQSAHFCPSSAAWGIGRACTCIPVMSAQSERPLDGLKGIGVQKAQAVATFSWARGFKSFQCFHQLGGARLPSRKRSSW